VQGARFYRACLDSHGFTNTELHVTGYNTDNRTNDDLSEHAGLPGRSH